MGRENTIKKIKKYAENFALSYKENARSKISEMAKEYMIKEIIEKQSSAEWWIENRSCDNQGFSDNINLNNLLTELSVERRKHRAFLKKIAIFKKRSIF